MNKLPGCNLEFVREDDFVEYFLFPQIPETLRTCINDNSDATVFALQQHLKTISEQCMEIVREQVQERAFIWHKDEFQLQIRTGSQQEQLLNDETSTENTNSAQLPPCLHGVTHYGDNIADEWFIVYLLSVLTHKISGLIARVVDSDGEFLLIEAADVLPKWANPDTCEQRVYISDGAVQLVQNSPSNTTNVITVAGAIEKLRSQPTLYRVSKDIQQVIEARLGEFRDPLKAKASLHRQIVRLPIGVAVVLKQQPKLVAAAVRAFCERDSIDTKVLRTMRYFPPEQRIRTNVCFTRCLYAMLMHSNYTPDRKIGWNLSGNINTEQYKEDILGVKLACGFEILASQAKDSEHKANDPAWRTYVRSLTTKGYFKNNLEGSEEYKRLLADAESFFKQSNERFRTAPIVGREVLALLRSDFNVEQLRDEENNLQPSDSDSWLNISAEELDAMLAERYGPKKLYKSNGDINAAEFAKNLSEFLEKESTYEGIDSDDDDIAEESFELSAATQRTQRHDAAKVKKNQSMRKACQQHPVAVNPRKTVTPTTSSAATQETDNTHVRNFLDFVIPEDNWDSNSEMSDYEDEDDIERNFEAMSKAEKHIDAEIQQYMAQMDRELAKTTIGQTFATGPKKSNTSNAHASAADDDFDDIENFKPININVNTLKNMMDSYKSQIGGPGPVSNLLNAMGIGMSVSDAPDDTKTDDLSESTV